MPGPSVYIIDDDPVIADMLALQLESAGYDVSVMMQAEAALSLIRRAPPDIVLLDLNMPGAGGLDVLAVLRAEGVLPQQKVLLVTGEDDTDIIGQAMAIGAAGHLVKPFAASQLLATMGGLLGTEAVAAEWQELPAGPASPHGAGDINPVIAGLLRSYGAKAVSRLLASLAGQLERLDARPDASPAELAKDAHAIMGAAGSLGFLSVSTACAALEQACRQGESLESVLREAERACAQARQQIELHLQAA